MRKTKNKKTTTMEKTKKTDRTRRKGNKKTKIKRQGRETLRNNTDEKEEEE